ncbi:uncharacterized protein TNCV_1617861 [Trichonephila clavipes]|nr:uncharacterized protein TNCV_1617861 [Trichonephila clavipes]
MGHERKRRQKKRKFHGNFRSAQKKIFDNEILMSIFSILSCPVYYNQELNLIEDSRLGLQSNLCLKVNIAECVRKPKKHRDSPKKCVVSHFCKNHKGSASNIETVGAYRIFERSEASRSLRYTSYYGDGDSKAFNNVKDIYGYDSVVKYECIGYVQKRVGSRLRKLKKSTKGLGGKGKLTDKFIDTLQNYFGIAIRSNVGNLSNMQTAVIAAFFHCCSTDKKPMHGQCPSGSDTWCKYQKAKQEGKLYKHRTAGLPNAVLNTV